MPTLQEKISAYSKPELAELTGMVYQVWCDGEITLQKSGSLLWNRGLHQMKPPLDLYIKGITFPDKSGENGFMFTDDIGAERVRELLMP